MTIKFNIAGEKKNTKGGVKFADRDEPLSVDNHEVLPYVHQYSDLF